MFMLLTMQSYKSLFSFKMLHFSNGEGQRPQLGSLLMLIMPPLASTTIGNKDSLLMLSNGIINTDIAGIIIITHSGGCSIN